MDDEIGNCLQASIASLFELDLELIPHFNLFTSPYKWEEVLSGFIWAMGYNWTNNGDPTESKIIKDCHTVGGFTEACVPSKNYPGKFHSVVIDKNGIVANDPHPKKSYQGIDIFKSGDVVSWMIFEAR